MGRAVHILKALNLSPKALATLITSNPNPAQAAPDLDTLNIKDPQKVFHSFRSTSNNRLSKTVC